MYRRIVLFSLFLLHFALSLRSDDSQPNPWGFPADRPDFDAATLLATGLPLVEVTTVDGEELRCDFVSHPEGAMGRSITNANTVGGRIVIRSKAEGVLYDSGSYIEAFSGATFRLRGNTSVWWGHRSIKVALQQKGDLITCEQSVFANKHWLLLGTGPWLDLMVGLKVNELIGMEWTPRWQFVNLMINGSYQGIYSIVEQVRRDPVSRINVDRFGGYLIECDPYWWNEPLYVRTALMHKDFTFKYPESEDVTTAQQDYVLRSLNELETAIEDGTYEEHIDVPSFARWLLAHDILGTFDSGGSNMFLAKQDESSESKWRMPCLWDFGSILRCENRWARVHDNFFYYAPLFASPNNLFARTYNKIWEEERTRIFSEMRSFLYDFRASELFEALERSHDLDRQRYDYEDPTTAEEVSTFLDWFLTRETWMAEAMKAYKPDDVVPTAIEHRSVQRAARFSEFDLLGRPSSGRGGFVVTSKGVFLTAKKPQLRQQPR